MRILVTGAAGQLGRRLVAVLESHHEVFGADVISTGEHTRLDITDFDAVKHLVAEICPEIVLHPAAWTDVDACARDFEKALRINGYGAQNVAVAAAEIGAAMLYISTNEVFDGKCCAPYHEYDARGPINPYAYSKLAGEKAVMAVNPRHYIVRTAWLFAHGGRNFVHTILKMAEQGRPLRVVTNEVANPTYNNDLADAIVQLIQTGRYGVYHLTNQGACSRYHLARYILDRAGYGDTTITPISSQEWQRDSTPPVYATLANTSGSMIGITLRPWQAAVDAFLAQEGLLR